MHPESRKVDAPLWIMLPAFIAVLCGALLIPMGLHWEAAAGISGGIIWLLVGSARWSAKLHRGGPGPATLAFPRWTTRALRILILVAVAAFILSGLAFLVSWLA
jgi:hypothetical protein